VTTAVGTMVVAFTRAAAPLFPAARSAADAAAARREASDTCGVPVSIVPFAKTSDAAAARFAASVKPAVASTTAAPLDAAFTAAAVTPTGSVEYKDAGVLAVELIDAANSAYTRIVTDNEPSELAERAGTTVMFAGATPPVAVKIASYDAEAASLCRAAMTAGSLALAGKAKERERVSGILTVSEKLINTNASMRVAAMLCDGVVINDDLDGDTASADIARLALPDKTPDEEGSPAFDQLVATVPPAVDEVPKSDDDEAALTVPEEVGVFELLGVMDGEAPLDRDDVGDAVAVEELVGEPEIDDVDVGSAVAVPLALGVELGVPVAEGDVEAVSLDDGEGVAGALALLLGLAPDDSEDVGDAESDALSDFVDDGDTEDVGDGVVVDAGEVVADGVDALEDDGSPLAEALTDGLGVSLGVREGLAPVESGGVAEAVMLAVRVADDELLTVLLLVRLGVSEVEELEDGVCVPVGDPVALVEAVVLEESDTLGEIDAEAPTVTDAVGVRELDAAWVSVLEGVANAVPEGVGDELPVPETVGVTVDVIEDESETVPELEGLAPLVRLAVGDLDCVLERLCVELAVDDDVGVTEVVIEPVPVCEGVTGEVGEAESETVDVGDDDSDGDGVTLAEPP
jgi:hypothetical protein